MSFKIEKIQCHAANESCVKAVHSSGLQIFISEKPDFNVNYAVFAFKELVLQKVGNAFGY